MSDHSLFIYHHGNDIAYILLYVDDIILAASSNTLRQSIMAQLSSEFAMKDLGPLSYFFGHLCQSPFQRSLSFPKEIRGRNYRACRHVLLQAISYTGRHKGKT
jgi:hypothetical protein